MAARLLRTHAHRTGVDETPETHSSRNPPAYAGWPACSDAALIEAVIAGSEDAFGELYDRYSARAFRVARSVCRDYATAEDAVQEAFLWIFKTRASYRSERGSLAAWVLTVVLSRAIDVSRIRSRHATRRAGDEALDVVPAPGDVVDQADARIEANRVRAALAELPDAQREAITLAFYGGLTHTEIAAHLEVPCGTVKGRIRLGMDKLRLALEPDEPALSRPDHHSRGVSRFASPAS